MTDDRSRNETLLAVALGSPRKGAERRMLPDRRSGVDRRHARLDVPHDRRSGAERRQAVRRMVDRAEGATLLQKARNRLGRPSRRQPKLEDPGNGLR
jgi:hypothetical protein